MRLSYGLSRNLDRIASFLRIFGLHRITRLVRNVIAKLFPKGITVEVNGHRLCGSIRDRAFLYKVKEKRFEPETLGAFSEVLESGMIVLDVGAYLGFFTLVSAMLVGPKGKVYAFEPDPFTFNLLEYNIRLNGYNNVVPVMKAVSNKKRITKLFQHGSDPSMTSLIPRAGWQRSIFVEAISIDEYLGNHQVDVVKIDVEGGEILALKGMTKLIANSPKITLFVELNPRSLSESETSQEDLLTQIKQMGFNSIIRLDEHRDKYGELELCNLLCRRSDKIIKILK